MVLKITDFQDKNPAAKYAIDALWGNPDNEKQYQVALHRISPEVGEINYFSYMGKYRPTPVEKKLFHVFTAGGIHPGVWNLGARFKGVNPINTWVNASILMNGRGVQLDFYDGVGKQYPRTKVWVLFTHDGLVLLAFESLNVYPIPMTKSMYFRCYSTDLTITMSTDAMAGKGNPYVVESMTYENNNDYSVFSARYSALKVKDGFTGVFVNGILKGSFPAANTLTIGDVVEIWHDPTVYQVLYYNYRDLKDFYSDKDQQRKFILHPPKTDDFTLRFFDDNDYYFVDGNGDGIYYHRNAASAVRQLTHADVSLSISQLKGHMEGYEPLRDISTARIMVIQRDTNWLKVLPWNHQRIQHLYRLSDFNILKAMTGERSVVPEWEANALENGPVMTYIDAQYRDITEDMVNNALGYNAETLAVSASPIKAEYIAGTKGIPVPPTYQETSTVWEYNLAGKLLGFYYITYQTHLVPKYEDCAKVEFTYGKASQSIHYEITNQDKILTSKDGFRVYSTGWSITTQQTTGTLTDRTGTDFYEIKDGVLIWKKLDKVNQRGVLVYDDLFLAREFELNHNDHSLCFSLDDLYENVDGNLPLSFAQIDVWLNGSPLIDNVDWLFNNRLIYINNREFIVDGAQKIVVRCYGQWSDITKPKSELELGFVEGGVIGNHKRYNIREDRNVRIVVGGKLMLLSELKTAETDPINDYANPLNGLPYMVKHTYTPNKAVRDYNFYYLYDLSRNVDKRVINYLTEYATKNSIVVDFNMQEKWLLYSPFMNVVANAINNGILRVPEKDTEYYSNQLVADLVKEYTWWLPQDPVILNMDLRYFGILPYANTETLVVSSNEFTFLKQVNSLYLKNVLSIEGYFEVSQNG